MLQFFITVCFLIGSQQTYNCCSFKQTAKTTTHEITNIISAIATSQELFALAFKSNLIAQTPKEFSTWFKYIKSMPQFIEKSYLYDYKNTKTMWQSTIVLTQQLKTIVNNANTIYASDASDFDKIIFIDALLQNTPQLIQILETLTKGLFELARTHKPQACILNDTPSFTNNDGYDLVYHVLLSLKTGYLRTLENWTTTKKNFKQTPHYQLLQEILHTKQETP